MKIYTLDSFGSSIRFGGRGCIRPRAAMLRLATAFSLLLVTDALAAGQPRFADISNLIPAVASATNRVAITGTNMPAAAPTNTMDTLDDKHTLAIGDRLSFRIVEDEDDPKELVVADSGELEIPYIGRFAAEGKTCRQLAFDLKKALEKEYYYQATVIIAVDQMAKSRGKVYLVGSVRAPGPQEIPSDEVFTLSKAILRSGGFTDFADQHEVKVTREGQSAKAKESFVVDVGEIFDKGKTEKDLVLHPGDLIYIPERMVRF